MAEKPVVKAMYVAFRTDKDTCRIFRLAAWKVKDAQIVGVADPVKPECGCALSRYDKVCEHRNIVMASVKDAIYPSGSREMVVSCGLMNYDPMEVVLVANADASQFHLLSPEIGDVSTSTVYGHVVEKQDLGFAEGVLNPYRLLAELKDAGASSINSDTVLAKGKAVGALPSLKALKDEVETMADPEPDDQKSEEEIAAEKAAAAAPRIWDSVRMPHPKNFYVEKAVWQQLIYSIHAGENVLLLGPSGAGKSELTYIAAQAMGREVVSFNMGAMSEPRSALIGNTHFDKEKGTYFEESRLVKAAQTPGSPLLFDELTRAERGAFNILLPFMDNQGYLSLDEKEDSPKIYRASGVSVLATANIGMEYTGTDAMDIALLNRFHTVIELDFPPRDSEVTILCGRTGIDKKSAFRLAKIAGKQRELMKTEEGDFSQAISTRMLLAAAKKIAAGMDFDTACRFSIIEHFSNAGGETSERTKVRQIIQKDGV